MTQHRIRIHTDRRYSGYFWDVERYLEPKSKKQQGLWDKACRGGYAFTYWGAKRAARKAAKKILTFQPFERIEELK